LNQAHPSRRIRRWLAAAIKLLIVAVVVWFIRQTILAAWESLGKHDWHFSRFSLLWLALAGLFFFAGTLLSGLFWHRVLRAMGQEAGLGETLRAYYIGHLGKYVPGKAMVVVLRTGMIRSQRVDGTLAAVSVFFETLTMMAVGAFLSAAVIAIWYRGHALLFWAAVAMMFASGVPVFPPVFRRLVRFLIGKWSNSAEAGLARVGYRITAVGWILNACAWALLGLSFWAVLRSIGAAAGPGDNPFQQLPTYTASVALATVAGFVSFVPGGAVVREAVLAELTKPQFGDVVALVSAVLLRLLWLVAELMISGILYLPTRHPKSYPPPSA
jgi:glycosyltransferase 2 family protein